MWPKYFSFAVQAFSLVNLNSRVLGCWDGKKFFHGNQFRKGVHRLQLELTKGTWAKRLGIPVIVKRL